MNKNTIYSLFYRILVCTIFFNATNNLIEVCTIGVYEKISSAHHLFYCFVFILLVNTNCLLIIFYRVYISMISNQYLFNIILFNLNSSFFFYNIIFIVYISFCGIFLSRRNIIVLFIAKIDLFFFVSIFFRTILIYNWIIFIFVYLLFSFLFVETNNCHWALLYSLLIQYLISSKYNVSTYTVLEVLYLFFVFTYIVIYFLFVETNNCIWSLINMGMSTQIPIVITLSLFTFLLSILGFICQIENSLLILSITFTLLGINTTIRVCEILVEQLNIVPNINIGLIYQIYNDVCKYSCFIISIMYKLNIILFSLFQHFLHSLMSSVSLLLYKLFFCLNGFIFLSLNYIFINRYTHVL